MKDTILDTNPFFGRDLDLLPTEEVFTRELLFEKNKKYTDWHFVSGVFDFAERPFVSTNSTIIGNGQICIHDNSISLGTADCVGGYDMAGNKGKEESFNFNINNKPNWLRRKMVKILLGWDWVDKEEK